MDTEEGKRSLIQTNSLWVIVAVVFSALIPALSIEDWFLKVFTLSFYILLLLVFHRCYNLLNWVDPTVMFAVSYATFIGIGIIATGYFGIVMQPSVLVAIIVGLASLLVGAVFLDLITSPSRRLRITRFTSIAAIYRFKEIAWAWIFFAIGIMILVFYYYSVGTIPLLAENAETVRVTAKAGRGYLPIGGFAFVFVSTAMITACYAKRHLLRFALYAGLPLVVGAILLLGVGYRMPAVRVLLNAFIIYSFVKRGRISKVTLLTLVLVIIIFLSLIGFYRFTGQFAQSPEQIEFAFSRAVWSIFVRYLNTLDLVMSFFPDHHPFMLGESYLISANTVLPGAQLHFGFWLRERLGLVFISPGPVDPTIIGEFYANFGWSGVVVGMSALGFTLRTLFAVFTRKTSISLRRVVLMVLISTSLIGVAGSGLILVLLFDLLPVVLVFLAYSFCVKAAWFSSREGPVATRPAPAKT